ncbi:MAG: glycosyltransferase family 2 protein, partial [Gemmatimonadaceae bacterium]|nr:glycosyltransferase family 2 protein [Gemmatimonadaceae bacterium]
MSPYAARALPMSVIVPTHNRSASLQRLLGALASQAADEHGVAPARFEVIVVADGCQDDTVAMLQESLRAGVWPFAVKLIEQSPARGAGIARNMGAAQASGRTLVFVDDDIEPFPTMLAEHDRRHAAAVARGASEVRGDPLLLIGAPVPVRTSDNSFQRIAAWGWWEQQFEAMSSPGHRFTYDQVFTGVLSMPAALFHGVGGFDALLGDCHEDSELGLRLFRAGARVEFARAAGGLHHELRNITQLLTRKEAEGRADVRILERAPELVYDLRIAEEAPPARSWLALVRRTAFRTMARSERLSPLALRLWLRLLALLERWRWRASWRFLHGAILTRSYWRGAAAEVGTSAKLASLVAESHEGWQRWFERARHVTVDLELGLEAAERLLDANRPDWITVRFGHYVVGSSRAQAS